MSQPHSMVFVSILISTALLFALGFYKKVLKKNVSPFALLLLLSLLPLWSIFRSGTYQSGDLTLHTNYLQSFFANLSQGIWIPQWAGGLCAGHGCPLFIFEYVMPFYIGSSFHALGFSFLNSMKLFLAFSFIASGVTMYSFLREHFDEKSAFLGSLLYLFAPIRFIEMHFRVSVGTDSAFIFIPLSFLFAKRSLSGRRIYVALGAINFLFLILSHSSMALVMMPVSIIYAFFIRKNLKDIFYPISSCILGIGLSAYYTLPAVTLVKHTWYAFDQKVTEFHPLIDHLISPARFGLLFQGNNGEFRLIVGYMHLLVIFLAIIFLFQNRFKKQYRKIVMFLLFMIFICFISLSSVTKPIWNSFFFLRSFILPWRMLVPIAFFSAFLGSIVVQKWKYRSILILAFFVVFSTILNWGNRKMVPFNDQSSFYGQDMLYTEYVDDAKKPQNIRAYSKVYQQINRDPAFVARKHEEPLGLLSGNGEIKLIKDDQIYHEYLVSLSKTSTISENTYYFPGWKLFVNREKHSFIVNYPTKKGVMVFTLPKGNYLIETKFEETPMGALGKRISIISLLITLILSISAIFQLTIQSRRYILTKFSHV